MVITVKAEGSRLIKGIGPGVLTGNLAAIEQAIDIGCRMIGVIFIGKGNRGTGLHHQLLRYKQFIFKPYFIFSACTLWFLITTIR